MCYRVKLIFERREIVGSITYPHFIFPQRGALISQRIGAQRTPVVEDFELEHSSCLESLYEDFFILLSPGKTQAIQTRGDQVKV